MHSPKLWDFSRGMCRRRHFYHFFQPFGNRKRDREIWREIDFAVVAVVFLFEGFLVPINIAVVRRASERRRLRLFFALIDFCRRRR